VAVALPVPLRRSFTYRVPEELPWPEAGTRVRVPFGERVLVGVVLGAAGDPPTGAVREVIEILDDEPVCPPSLLSAAVRAAERFFAGPGEILKSALPAKLPAGGAVRYRITEKGILGRVAASGAERDLLERLASGDAIRVIDLPGSGRARRDLLRELEERKWLRAASPSVRPRPLRAELAYLPRRLDPQERSRRLGRSRRGREVLDWLDRVGRPASAAEVELSTGAGRAVLRDLSRKGLLASFEQVRRAEPAIPPRREAVTLTPEQSGAVAVLASAIRERRFFPALLEGVTGSGKTEVYLRAIGVALEAGRGAVWLVPEIALTPVFARQLASEFGERAAVLHSALSPRERARAWDRLRRGEVRAVIGPRSAVFAPVADPGLFVVDEEHDTSYKQREAPRYDAREVAALRASSAEAALVFGSATPSLEVYHAARSGRLTRLELPRRIEDRPLPRVQIVDLRREPARPDEKGVPLFSAALLERLRQVFARGEQAILLQPRRGFAPFLLCRDCGFDFGCTRCSVSRTVHERGRRLLCHYCGERRPRPERCPSCGGTLLEAIGAGTERVEERFAELFPGISCAVLDRDTARRRGVSTLVEEMAAGRVSCLIGTQMVAKGHDFPGVTAVGVLSADTILNFPDFRAAEKTFQLVAQVAGRAGRGERAGTVHVQTFHPGHPAIQFAARHDLHGFAQAELEFRRTFFYPPFSELAAILVSSGAREKAEAAAEEIGRKAQEKGTAARISGPAPAPFERLQGKWRFQILLRTTGRTALLELLESSVPDRAPAGVQIAVDVDPQDLM
jgi:primosomal protein N' (replication factor Y) (superfamily II helicase)